MREIHFKQKHPQLGEINGVMRVIGKLIYLKFNSNQYSQQVLTQLASKGAKIQIGRDWIQVDMFFEQERVKLGNIEFNIKEKTDVEMELILSSFYIEQYKKAGMEVSEK